MSYRNRRPYAAWHWGCAMGKGAFIRLKGRAAWARLPRHAIFKDGKRAYITREAFEDNLWLATVLAPVIQGQ